MKEESRCFYRRDLKLRPLRIPLIKLNECILTSKTLGIYVHTLSFTSRKNILMDYLITIRRIKFFKVRLFLWIKKSLKKYLLPWNIFIINKKIYLNSSINSRCGERRDWLVSILKYGLINSGRLFIMIKQKD